MSTFQVLLSCLLLVLSTAAAQLQAGFYSASCPQVESAVKALVGAAIGSGSDPDLAAKLLRLTFHDCFVNGCDGSILLDTAGAGTKTEKQAEENRSLRESGFQFLDKLKDAVEAQCPETVSCPDILALAARDAVSVPFGRDLWEVPTRRRDSRVSREEDVPGNLPSQFDNFAKLKFMFERQNLSTNELVALSGAHTIGLSTCGSFSYRLYNFRHRRRRPRFGPGFRVFPGCQAKEGTVPVRCRTSRRSGIRSSGNPASGPGSLSVRVWKSDGKDGVYWSSDGIGRRSQEKLPGG